MDTENKKESQNLLPIGTLLKNVRYRIDRYIASGGFGNTYKAFDIEKNKVCAVKEFFINGDNHREANSKNVSVSNPVKQPIFESMKSKFKKEANRLMEINNVHIVYVYDCFEENNTAYYVMELIDGERLDHRIKANGKVFTEQEAKDVLQQMLDALKSIHDNGIIHMDIKPANIMMDSHGLCKLIDFGASKQTEMDGMTSTSSAVCYTQGYAPPEQVSGNKTQWGPWTDFYALGATIYNIITGSKPPTQDELLTYENEALNFPEYISANLKETVIWMMQLSVKKRPQKVNDILPLLQVDKEKKGDASENNENTVYTDNSINDDSTIVESHDDISVVQQNPQMIKDKPKINSKAWVWTALILLALAGGGYSIYLFSKDKAIKKSYFESDFCPDSNHPHVIDLGIGVKFACCNVGANAPWEYGGYYAWGETEEKNDYYWGSYIHCYPFKGFFLCHNLGDNIADTKYDVAHVKWGGKWKMPNKSQLELLKSECEYEWTSLNGVNGGKFTGPNGNSIFLPAAGFRWLDETGEVGYCGNYWSSTRGSTDSYGADGLTFNTGKECRSHQRMDGLSVRPVTEI